jgi:hypothetical protein
MIHTDDKREQKVDLLEGLISILEDGKLGYTNAAEHVENAAIKTDFLDYARQRAFFIVELQDEINRLVWRRTIRRFTPHLDRHQIVIHRW